MKYVFFTCSLFLTFFISVVAINAQEIGFSRNLSQGMSGQDVLQLQKILNANPATQISTSGAGSPGNETTYFGGLTAQAVIKFQEVYAQETLVPAGLTRGTGFVGPLTRTKLRTFGGSTPQNTISAPINPNIDLPVKRMDKVAINKGISQGIVPLEKALGTVMVGSVTILGTSHEFIKPGDKFVITGFGFKPLNSVFFGSKEVKNVIATTTDTIIVTVPEMTNGTYKLYVTNNQGSSLKNANQFVTISSQTKPRPVITSSFPTSVGINDTLTIKGTGFASSGNEIHSVLGTIKNVSSSNGVITINVKDFSEVAHLKDSQIVKGMSVYFRIKSSTGLSENFGYFVFNGK